MWNLIKNEWIYLLRTKLLLGISLTFVLGLILSMILGNSLNQKQSEASLAAKDYVRAEWENIDGMNPHGAAHFGTYVFKEPNLLSSLDEGVNDITGNVLWIEGHVQNEMVFSEASQMLSISKFGKLKSALFLKYIVPLFLIFLGFSAISRERQSGRLKLLVHQGSSPTHIIWAKFLAIWMVGISLLALVMLAYSIMNGSEINADTFQRALFLFLSYALYYFIITGLTIFFSARWQNATVALTSMLGIWIVWTVFLPNIFLSSVEKWHPLPSRYDFQNALREDRSKGIDGHNPSDVRKKDLVEQVLQEYKVDSLSQLPINFDGLLMQADEEYGNKVWDKHFGSLRNINLKQKRKMQWLGVLDPYISLQNLSMGFAGSDNLHHQDFLLQAENYRRGFIKELNDKHAFGGSKTGDWDWEADNEFYKSIPDFNYELKPITQLATTYFPDVGVLFLWAIMTIGLFLFGANKMSVL